MVEEYYKENEKVVYSVKGKFDQIDLIAVTKSNSKKHRIVIRRKNSAREKKLQLTKIAKIRHNKSYFNGLIQKPDILEIITKNNNSHTLVLELNQINDVAMLVSEFKKCKELDFVEKAKAKAKERERARDYEAAIQIWERLGEIDEAARVRKTQAEMGSVKVSQKVVHGDEVTEIKDSVLNRSNVGGSSSKMQDLRELTGMKEKGLIDDDEFKQMKKEILGK
tara:strand:- start:399 stop:1064 length:666 start_codon:yes stop_codon:yes gene_type:complete